MMTTTRTCVTLIYGNAATECSSSKSGSSCFLECPPGPGPFGTLANTVGVRVHSAYLHCVPLCKVQIQTDAAGKAVMGAQLQNVRAIL